MAGTESSAEQLTAIVQRFVAGQPFMEFWRAFMDFHDAHPEPADLSAAEQASYEQLYELAYMGAADPVAPEDHAVGLVGEAELRERLRSFTLGASSRAG